MVSETKYTTKGKIGKIQYGLYSTCKWNQKMDRDSNSEEELRFLSISKNNTNGIIKKMEDPKEDAINLYPTCRWNRFITKSTLIATGLYPTCKWNQKVDTQQ